MTYIPQIGTDRAIDSSATYNAVKIKINDPKTNITEGFKNSPDDKGIYNAVDIEVNRPSVETGVKPLYNYSKAPEIITYDMARPNVITQPVKYPTVPVAYQTNYISNKTLINAEIEYENKAKEKSVDEQKAEVKIVTTPAPYVTTPEKEKNLNFHGISFRADNKVNGVEIVPPQEIERDVDVEAVLSNLANKNYDIQAQQMEEIAKISFETPEKAVPFVVKEIFISLEEIANKNTENLPKPSQAQIDARKKIIMNEIIKEQAVANGQDPAKIELPYNVTDEDKKLATTLTEIEQAERNKEYALYTMASLAKVYTNEIEKQTGNVVPMTDLPGISAIVDTLRYSENPSVKIAAIDSLRYLARQEYKEELRSIFTLAANDQNPYVARNAVVALTALEN